MPVSINEVNTEVHAFDSSALLTEEILQTIVTRVVAEMARRSVIEAGRDDDRGIRSGRRIED